LTVNILFVVILSIALALLFVWSFSALPKERWQILAAVPTFKEDPERWRGVNFTYYGLFSANAYAVATAILLVLTGSISVPLPAMIALAGTLFAACIPSSKLIARVVEKKRHTFTIGGASFLGILMAPWAITLLNRMISGTNGSPIPPLPTLAALSIAYLFGEGLGRLACISFGCCYGKPLSECPPIVQRLFSHLSFTFSGETKKIAYASGTHGKKVLPIQGITAVVYAVAGLGGIVLFINGQTAASFVLCVAAAQGWRSFSECLRADYRGEGKITVYQVMGAVALVYSVIIGSILRDGPIPRPHIAAGLKTLWDPGVILSLQALWAYTFYYTGRSMVTGSSLSFYVHRHRI